MRKKIFTILIICALPLLNIAQNTFFSDTNYLVKLKDFISPTFGYYKDYPDIYKKFSTNWTNKKLDAQKFGIVYVSNELYNSKAKPHPAFYYYLQTINTLIDNNNLDIYREWEVGLMTIISNKNTQKTNNFLEFSYKLIKDSILAQTPTLTWKIKCKNFSINNDPNTDDFIVSFGQDIEIICFSNQNPNIDTMKIKQTNGICYIADKKFIGKYGKITWEAHGYKEDENFVRFGDYQIDMKTSKIQIENAQYTNVPMGIFKMPGKLTTQLSPSSSSKIYPQFEGNEKIEITKMYKDVVLKGYLRIEGSKFKLVGKEFPAEMSIFENTKKAVVIKSQNFELNNQLRSQKDTSRIYSPSAFVLLNIGGVTVKHDYVTIRYSPIFERRLFDTVWFKPYKMNFKNGYYLDIQRSDAGPVMQPFNDVSHSFYIYCDRILWRKGDSLAYLITTATSKSPYVSFQSYNFFNKAEYDYFNGEKTDGINHLEASFNISKKYQQYSISDYQKYIFDVYQRQLPTDAIKKLFQELSYAGFIDYNRNTQMASVTQKTIDILEYYKRYKFGDIKYKDYDLLELISRKNKSEYVADNAGINGYFNFTDGSLNILNLRPFKLSPSVIINSNEVSIAKGKLFFKNGFVGAGLSKYTDSTGFVFNYDKYTIDISDAKAEYWTADTVNQNIYLSDVSSILEGINATIEVNAPNNKSNTVKMPKYPRIGSSSTSYIYYDKFYKNYSSDTSIDEFRKKFYFKADNFSFEDLNNINDSNLILTGTFYSGLFAPINVKMSVRKTSKGKTLGFEECTGKNEQLKDGLAFKDAKFFGCFGLNDDGLFGNGYILYHSSYCKSKSFAFLPNQVKGEVDSFVINNNIYSASRPENIAEIEGNNVSLDWKDKMIYSTKNKKKNKISIYKSQLSGKLGTFDGEIYYSVDSTKGKGDFKFTDAILNDTVKGFEFYRTSFETKTCNFQLQISQKTNFSTKNLNGKVDIPEQLGSFYSNADTSRIYFSNNRYYCIMDHFLWKIGEGIVSIGGVMPGKDSTNYVSSLEEKKSKKNDNIKLFGTILVNVDDTLTFNAATTTYKINEQKIVAENVQKIKIADANIYPQGTVTILTGGTIDTLKKISFEFPFNIFDDNKPTKNTFLLHHSDVIIKNRYNYSASKSTYSYPFNNQPIVFNQVNVKNAPQSTRNRTQSINYSSLYTFGEKNIDSKDTLWLNSYFLFHGTGKIQISAKRKYLTFTGFSKIDSVCHNIVQLKSFKIDSLIINPDSVNFQISSVEKSATGNSYSGIFWSIENRQLLLKPIITGRFDNGNYLNSESNQRAWSVFQNDGTILFNQSLGEYRFSNNQAMLYSNSSDTLSGSLLVLNNNFCNMKAQGEFNLFLPWDIENNKAQYVKTLFKGFYRYNIENNTQVFNGVLAVDFPIPPELLTRLVQLIADNTNNQSVFSSKSINQVQKNYNVYLGYQKSKKLFDQLASEYSYSIPEELKHTFVFSDVTFYYSQDSTALISTNNVGIATINGVPVDTYVKCKIFYSPKGNIPNFFIVFSPSADKYIGFHYIFKDNNSYMKIYLSTGDQDFDSFVQKMKKREIQKNYELLDEDLNVIAPFIRELKK